MSKVTNEGKKNALLIMVNFVWMFILYRGCVFWTDSIQNIIPYAVCTTVYLLAASALMVTYFFTGDPSRPETRKKALLAWAFPILVCLIIDVLDLVLIDYFIKLFTK